MRSSKFAGSAALVALAAGIAGGATAQDKTLTITSWGGAYSTSQREAYYKPYQAKTGVKVLEEEYNGELSKIKAMVEAKKITWDIVDTETAQALQGCDEGVWEKIDYSKIGDRSKFIPGSAMDCAVGTIVWATIYAFDERKFPASGPQPKTMADFFDVAKFPGPRALEKRPKVNLEFALIGDGVPAKDVYKVLATKEGVDRAFKKLSALKPHVKVWWEGGAKPPQLLSDGEVAMSTAYNGRIYDAVKKDNKPFKIVWDGQVWDLDLWAIPKGSPKLDMAYDFIKFASDPNVMANQSKFISYGPTHVDAVPKIAPEVLPHLPTAPDNFKNAVQSSTSFWADKYDEINERFQKWLAQ